MELKVTLYSTNCPKCRVLEAKLNEKNIEFVTEGEDVMIEKGFLSAPMLEVDGEVMNFGDAMRWVMRIE